MKTPTAKVAFQPQVFTPKKVTCKNGKNAGEVFDIYDVTLVFDMVNEEHASFVGLINEEVSKATNGAGLKYPLVRQKKSYARDSNKKKMLDADGKGILIPHPSEVMVQFVSFKPPKVTDSDSPDLNKPIEFGTLVVLDVNIETKKGVVRLYLNEVEVISRPEVRSNSKKKLNKVEE